MTLYPLEHARTFWSLESARRNAFQINDYRMDRDRYVIISDVHKGDRSGDSDDFQHNDTIYCHALQYYFDHGYRLILNGDVEDCWECNPKNIIHAYYKTALDIERHYNLKKRHYFRTFGNHDDVWQHAISVHRYLVPVIGPVTCHQAIMLGENVMIVHGHQGDLWADTGAGITRQFVHYIWKYLEDRYSYFNSRAAYNNTIRNTRDKCLFTWALNNKYILIAGHTHRAMFSSLSRVDQLRAQCVEILSSLNSSRSQRIRDSLRATVENLKAEIDNSDEEYRQDKMKNRLGDDPVPCYFNSGSCTYSNGMTSIEIDRGQIRLVKWEKTPSPQTDKVKRNIFQENNLGELMQRIKHQV